MQDNARGHSAKDTIVYMANKGLYPIFWPANSPDLNPIEDIWEKMKDCIEEKASKIHRSYKKLREVVEEAWNTVAHEDILELIRSMPKRCQAVIDAKGWHTEF
jgi:transposase